MDIFERVKKLDLPLGEYAVFGSGLLDAWSIRKANDLDIIVTEKLFEELKRKGYEKKWDEAGFKYLTIGEADITTAQDIPTHGNYLPDRNKLIKEAVVINGIPFAAHNDRDLYNI